MSRRRVWTPEMDAVLRAEYEATPVRKLKEKTGWDVDVKAITCRARLLGLRRTSRESFWTEERDQQLRDLYPLMTTQELIKRLQWTCSLSNVHQRAHLLGIKKKTAEIQRCVLKVQEHQGYRILTHRMGG